MHWLAPIYGLTGLPGQTTIKAEKRVHHSAVQLGATVIHTKASSLGGVTGEVDGHIWFQGSGTVECVPRRVRISGVATGFGVCCQVLTIHKTQTETTAVGLVNSPAVTTSE
jgi:hypothetical protein